MLVYYSGHNFHFECENLCRVFYPYSPVKKTNDIDGLSNDKLSLYAVISEENGKYTYCVKAREGVITADKKESFDELSEYYLTALVFETLKELKGEAPLWGMLTGIHPVKLLREYTEKFGEEKALDIFKNKFFVSDKKLMLAKTTLKAQLPVINALQENDFSLYISIPFCPTRCSYCSFVSADIAHAGKLIVPYFELLLEEIQQTSETVKELGLRLVSVYIGGGTPTTLSAEQLKILCAKINACFDFTSCSEFTVEAGRPDTIDREKLTALKDTGVTRISINPQSLNEVVLKNIGRLHTAKDIEEAFAVAKAIGFSSINSDLIVGLEGDSKESFQDTLERVIGFGATNITVHSLALKRSANMITQKTGTQMHSKGALADSMMDLAANLLNNAGYEPYYLYRQSRMAGNLENTGFALKGDICKYNIYTMDESTSVIACGAGGVSKLLDPYTNRLLRIFNFKFPYEYIDRNNEIRERKKGVKEFYEQFRKRLH